MKKRLSLQDKVLLVMTEAMREAIERHKREQWPLAQKSIEQA
jgi:hypothetical protein